jgi:hypothetical protein
MRLSTSVSGRSIFFCTTTSVSRRLAQPKHSCVRAWRSKTPIAPSGAGTSRVRLRLTYLSPGLIIVGQREHFTGGITFSVTFYKSFMVLSLSFDKSIIWNHLGETGEGRLPRVTCHTCHDVVTAHRGVKFPSRNQENNK